MGAAWFPLTAPTAVPSPDAGYYAIFIADGTGGTTSGSLYSKDSAAVVTALTFSNEQAQDAVGSILTDTATVDFTYDDAGNTISAIVIAGSIGTTQLANAGPGATGPLGSASVAPIITIDAKGRVSALTSATITPAAIGAPSGSGTHTGTSSGTNTGDQTFTASADATAPGSVSNLALTLATVNANVGAFGSASQVGTFTVNAKGLTTAAGNTSIAIAESQVTNLTTDLAAKVPTARTLTTTTPLQIDGGAGPSDLGSNRTLSILPATTTLAGSLSALDKKKLNQVWKDAVTDGGLDPTGASNCTVLLQALHDSLPANGGTIFFPVGDYRFDSTVNITKDGTCLLGQGRRTSRLATTSATLDMFNVTGDAVLFEGLRFTTMVGGVIDNTTLRTAGYAVNFGTTTDSSGMRKCDILFQWSGIHSQSSLQFFEDINIREYGNNAINGSCILIDGAGDRYISRLTTDNGSNPTGFAGIRVNTCASLVISDSNIIHAGIALALEPGNGQTIPSVEAVNTFFDTSVFGMQITTTGTGQVLRCKFTGCWFGTHTTAGVRMNGSQWDGITFDNCEWYSVGPSAIGIDCPSGGGKWTLSNSRIAGYTTGINLVASATHFPQIQNNVIGPTSGFGLNTTGITVAAGTYKGLMIIDNFIGNNTTAITLGAVTVAAGEASFYQIKNNAGYNPLTGAAVTTPAVGASTVAVTNTTGRRVLVLIKIGTTAITAVVINGVTVTTFFNLVASTFSQVFLEPGGTIAFTYTVVPTWVWIGQ